MKPIFKIWVHIEKIDEDANEEFEDQGIPEQYGPEYNTLEEAEAVVAELMDGAPE